MKSQSLLTVSENEQGTFESPEKESNSLPDVLSPTLIGKKRLKSQHDYDALLEIQNLNIISLNKLQGEVFDYKKSIFDMNNTIESQTSLATQLATDLENERKINVLLNGKMIMILLII